MKISLPSVESQKTMRLSMTIQASWLNFGSLTNTLSEYARFYDLKLDILASGSGLLGRTIYFQVIGPENKVRTFEHKILEL